MGDYKLPPPPEGLIWKYTPGRYMDKISLVKQGLLWDCLLYTSDAADE